MSLSEKLHRDIMKFMEDNAGSKCILCDGPAFEAVLFRPSIEDRKALHCTPMAIPVFITMACHECRTGRREEVEAAVVKHALASRSKLSVEHN